MLTISKLSRSSYRDRGSKFEGYLHPVSSKQEFESVLEQVRRDHPSASHHCYAYRIDPSDLLEFDQDDGEPGGTAGKPILNRLRSAELVNCSGLVVRYFGGTKLGTSGLIEAYGHTIHQCIETAEMKTVRLLRKIRITHPYSEQKLINILQNKWNLIELDADYTHQVTIVFGCDPEKSSKLEDHLQQESSWRSFTYEMLDEEVITG
jgi:uncharacterized YigZ family protein